MQCLLEVTSTEQHSPGNTCIMSCPRGFCCPQVGQRGRAEPILWEGLLPLALTQCVCGGEGVVVVVVVELAGLNGCL